MKIKPAARGNAVLLGLGAERSFGVPGGALVGYDPVLPLDGGLGATKIDNPQVNRTGYTRSGIPGDKGGAPYEFHHPVTAGHLLEFVQHLFRSNEADGSLVKTELEAGEVYRYVFEPVLEGVDTSFWALMARPPVDLFLRTGIKFGEWVIPIGEALLQVDLTGLLQHGSDLGPTEAAAANTGTYTLGPWARGPLADPAAGSVWVHVESLAPLVFKVLQAAAEPVAGDWTGAATTFQVAVDEDGEAIWQRVLSSETGLDLGVMDEDKDPLEIIWPGTSVEHADLAVGDVFELPVSWEAPGLSTISGHQRFTRAHWLTYYRAVGAGAWVELQTNSGQINLSAAVEAARGNGSRYPYAVDRVGEAAPSVQLVRDYRDTVFRDRQGGHVETRQLLEGQQLGTGAHRESIEFVMPNAEVTGWSAPASDTGKIQETVDLVGRTDDAGSPPVTVTVITSRDWTPAT